MIIYERKKMRIIAVDVAYRRQSMLSLYLSAQTEKVKCWLSFDELARIQMCFDCELFCKRALWK